MISVRHAVFAAAVLSVTTAGFAITPDVVNRGWKPQVDLIGSGDPDAAVSSLRDMTELQRVILRNTEFHEQTQRFIDELWLSLESFNLDRYYNLLPETDGEWRQLKVYGSRNGKLYQVGPVAEKVGFDAAGGDFALGDMSALIRAKKLASSGDTHYLLQNSLELGVGQVKWSSVQQASQETLRIMVDGSPAFSSQEQAKNAQLYRDKVIRMNPLLGSEDIDVIAPLWSAFPALWDMLAQLGKIEDVVYHDTTQGYRQLKVSFVIEPEKMKQHYPAISNHILTMDRLFNGSLRLSDERGELFSGTLDSRTLRGNMQMFVANGRVVPVKGGQVVLDAPPIPDGEPWEFSAVMDGTVSVLGVVTHLQNMNARIQYLSTADGVKVVSQVTEVPDISVKGNALGIMPTSMINVVLPKNLDQIMKEFMAVACKGNDGKGILVGAQFQQASEGKSARLLVKSAFEGLDNFFVRFGMSIVSDRVIPDPKVSEEIRRMAFDAQAAFEKDLEGFASIASLQRIADNKKAH